MRWRLPFCGEGTSMSPGSQSMCLAPRTPLKDRESRREKERERRRENDRGRTNSYKAHKPDAGQVSCKTFIGPSL